MSQAAYQVCMSCGRWTFNIATASCESTRCTSIHRADLIPFSDEPRAVALRRETFVGRAVRSFAENVRSGATRANAWRTRMLDRVQGRMESLLWGVERETANKVALGLGGAIWAASVLAVVFGSGAGGLTLVGLLVVTPIISALVAVSLMLTALVGSVFCLLVVAPAAVFAAFGAWLSLYSTVEAARLAGRLSLLVPLGGFVATTRTRQAWDGIFYTCPSRTCAYRGLPLHVCPSCGEGMRDLWPNLYGLLDQECPSCGERLPTLDGRGRDRLERRCGGCEMPLMGRHAGRARERLVAVAGGTGSGKTNYLLMAVAEAATGHAALGGEIDDDAQREDFRREWRNLSAGVPAPKTSEVASAFLLYANVGGERCQLYLYDAPGEEFASIGRMAAHQYFPLLEGIVLLVDPLSFDAVREREGVTDYPPVPLGDVVTSTLVTASAGKLAGRDGKIPLRVAVVISKADLASVRERIGGGCVSRGEACRAAIAAWGGESSIRAVEHRFSDVEYFACSPLGRHAGAGREPFEGRGVVDPLVWVLSGDDAA